MTVLCSDREAVIKQLLDTNCTFFIAICRWFPDMTLRLCLGGTVGWLLTLNCSGLREKRGVAAWGCVSFQWLLDWKSWLLTHAFIIAHQRVVNTVATIVLSSLSQIVFFLVAYTAWWCADADVVLSYNLHFVLLNGCWEPKRQWTGMKWQTWTHCIFSLHPGQFLSGNCFPAYFWLSLLTRLLLNNLVGTLGGV